MLYCWQAVGDCVRNLLIRVMPLHEANTIMELAALNVAAMLFRCQLLQQRIKGLKIIVDAVNAVRVSWRHGVHCPTRPPPHIISFTFLCHRVSVSPSRCWVMFVSGVASPATLRALGANAIPCRCSVALLCVPSFD
jgi:hypothetical protein